MNIRTCKPLATGLLTLCWLTLSGCSDQPPPEQNQAPISTKAVITPENWPKQASPFARNPDQESKIQALLDQMSLEQKVGQIIQADIASVTPKQVRKYHLGSVLNGGNSAPQNDNRVAPKAWLELADRFWEASTDTSDGRPYIPAIWGTDAVHGHSNVVGATIFPHNIGLGAARDPELMTRIGAVTAREMLVTGMDWTFAPTIAVARDDRWGRTYEAYSEDPELVSEYAPRILEGIQGELGSDQFLKGEKMLATVKHFLGDGGTEGGEDQGDSRVSEAELRDLFAQPYYHAVEAGASVVMASYNSWHGHKMHGFEPMLSDVLVGRMGFDGFVVGDWNGHGQVADCEPESCAQSFNAGLDMFMAPDSWEELYHNTLTQVKDGRISRERLDEAVARVLRVKFRMGLFDEVKPSERPLAGRFELLGAPEHRAVARKAARKSMVLLKNNDNILPFSADSRVLVAGDGADNIGKQTGGWTLSWQGTGNANSDFPNGESFYSGLKKAMEVGGGTAILSENGRYQKKPDLAVVTFGEDPYAEFIGDRSHLDFADDRGLQLLTEFQQAGIPTVAVFLSGRPLWVNPELNRSDAFVAAFLPGTEGGALADLLVRSPEGEIRYNFQGKLSFSWPRNAKGELLNRGDEGYDPLFAYGYGLSYQDHENLPQLPEESGLSAEDTLNISRYFYAGKPVSPWRLLLNDEQGQVAVDDPRVDSPAQAILARARDYQQQEDSLALEFTGPGRASFALEGGESIDLHRQMNGDMAMQIEYRVIEQNSARVQLGMSCGADCEARLDITEDLSAASGDWGTTQILLSCFIQADEDFAMDSVTSPLFIDSEAGLSLQLAQIQLTSNEGQANCRW